MLRLCRKDFIANRWFWLLALIVYLLYGVFSTKQDAVFMVMAVAFLLSLVALPLITEDHYRTKIFFCSLPVDRSTVVGARYLLSGFIILIGGLLVFGYRFLLYSLVKINDLKISPFPLLTLEELSGFVTLAAFLICLYYPLYFRYGLAKGAFLLTLIFLALLITATGIRFLAPWLGARGLFTLRSLARVKDLLGPALFLLGTVALNLAVVFFSIRLSIRFYDRRDF
jgi:ABC-2 type transport system permease protein